MLDEGGRHAWQETTGFPSGALPKRVSLLCRQPVSKANTQFLYTFDAANASRAIQTEQAAIGSFVREPPHSAQAEVDPSWSQLPGLQVAPVP